LEGRRRREKREGVLALGCAMGGRERCLFVANESVWRGEVFEMYWWGRRERDICAWLRHGREGELRCVYKELGFKLFGSHSLLPCASFNVLTAWFVRT
jgi:hypothetical protein